MRTKQGTYTCPHLAVIVILYFVQFFVVVEILNTSQIILEHINIRKNLPKDRYREIIRVLVTRFLLNFSLAVSNRGIFTSLDHSLAFVNI